MPVDNGDVRRLLRELESIPTEVLPAVRGVVQRGAFNIKNDWRDRWKGMSHLPALHAAVTYDTEVYGGGVRAQIGPDKRRRQGPLGNIAEFGTPKNAPHPGGGPALAAEEPKFLAELGKAIDKVVDL